MLFIIVRKFGTTAADQEILYTEKLVHRNMFALKLVFHPHCQELQQLLRQLHQDQLVQLDDSWVTRIEDETIDLIVSVL